MDNRTRPAPPGVLAKKKTLIAAERDPWARALFALQQTTLDATHLVVLDSEAELDGATALVAAPTTALAGNAIWVGAVQQITAALPTADWLWLDGTAVTGWGGVEPNDRDRQENREEQFARIEKGKLYLQDSAGSGNDSALCECDGKPISQAAAAAITDNRPAS